MTESVSVAPEPAANRDVQAMMDGSAYVDGEFCSLAEAKIGLLDWGFIRSDATYDVVHVWQGRLFRLDDHVERFLTSIERLRMQLPVTRDELVEILMECVRRSNFRDASVRMVCSRGMPPLGAADPRDPRLALNRLFMTVVPFVWIANAEQRQRGLHLTVSNVRRIPPESIDPTIKNHHWLDLTFAQFEAYDRGGDTAAVIDVHGNVTEGPGFNIFMVQDGEVFTAPEGVLEGITRKVTAELCGELGIPFHYKGFSAEELRAADEAFIASTGGGLMPVTMVDDHAFGNREVGRVTQRLFDAYWAKHDDPTWTTPVDYEPKP